VVYEVKNTTMILVAASCANIFYKNAD